MCVYLVDKQKQMQTLHAYMLSSHCHLCFSISAFYKDRTSTPDSYVYNEWLWRAHLAGIKKLQNLASIATNITTWIYFSTYSKTEFCITVTTALKKVSETCLQT